jgi:hypothetical protein
MKRGKTEREQGSATDHSAIIASCTIHAHYAIKLSVISHFFYNSKLAMSLDLVLYIVLDNLERNSEIVYYIFS